MRVQTKHTGLAFQNGYDVLKNKGIAIVGLSVGNSYFTQGTIDELLEETTNRFSQTIIMITDKLALHTYKAVGYNHEKAEKKARLDGNALRNRVERSIENVIKEEAQQNIELVDWEEVQKTKSYQQEYENILHLYENNQEFKNVVRDNTKKVLNRKLKPGVKMEQAIDEAKNYLLKELAFLLATPDIYNQRQVADIYHKNWPVFEKLINGEYNGVQRRDLGFIIIR